MCRNIRSLHNFEPPATREEAHDAALQYVRKISGSTKPSKANEEAFERAVAAVTAATTRLLDELVTAAPPRTVRSRPPRRAPAARSATRRSTAPGEAHAGTMSVLEKSSPLKSNGSPRARASA